MNRIYILFIFLSSPLSLPYSTALFWSCSFSRRRSGVFRRGCLVLISRADTKCDGGRARLPGQGHVCQLRGMVLLGLLLRRALDVVDHVALSLRRGGGVLYGGQASPLRLLRRDIVFFFFIPLRRWTTKWRWRWRRRRRRRRPCLIHD